MQSNGYVAPSLTPNRNGFFDTMNTSHQQYRNDQIEGVSIEELTERFGSPLFVFSERALRAKYHEAYTAFSTRYPDVQFAWSYKTNYLKAICKVFHEEGSIAEVVSDFEYEKARKLGIPGHQIIVNGPYKSETFLRLAVSENAKIQVDNHQEIGTIEKIAEEIGRPVNVAIRVNMVTGCEPAWTKFGFNFESGDAMLAVSRVCSSEHLNLVGLHSHIGTFILDPNQYRVSMQNLCALVWGAYTQYGVEVEYINAGGGFASANTLHYQYLPGKDVVPSFNQYAEAICDTLLLNLPKEMPTPKLYLETGRALVDEAGYLITSVLHGRHSGDGRQSLVVDAGINLLYTAAWYKFDIQTTQPFEGPVGPTTLYGPLCMNIDVIRQEVYLPTMSPGQTLLIHPVGAYNITQSMQFITYRPAVVMIGLDGTVDIIRRAENLEHVEALEELPERMQDKPVKNDRRRNGTNRLTSELADAARR